VASESLTGIDLRLSERPTRPDDILQHLCLRGTTVVPELQILYLDNHLLVVNKPAGVLVQADDTGDLDLLTLGKHYLKERFHKPGEVYLGLVHRLDRPASGVMVFARTSKAAARLSEQFKSRMADKRYLALVEGEAEAGGRREEYLGRGKSRMRVVDRDHAEAQLAILQWRSLGYSNGVTLVDIRLETGRKHQIRVQLAESGHPILGDFRYGATRELDGRNLALHCYRLGLDHPTRSDRLSWSVTPPESWAGFFEEEIAALIEEV
jgi:23S rRNA pseudouridine1911/1915/1917 synthase